MRLCANLARNRNGFSIKDDLFDYGEQEIGNLWGSTSKKKNDTTLIYALSKAGWVEKRRIINIVKNESGKPKKVKEVIEFVKRSGGLQYAVDSMNRYHQEAIDLLTSYPDTPYKQSLVKLVQFTIERNN